MNTPSISDLSATMAARPNRPNQRLNVWRFETISSVVGLETSGTRTGHKNSQRVRNDDPNANIDRDLKKQNYDRTTLTGRAASN
jgi:hypothetical protein